MNVTPKVHIVDSHLPSVLEFHGRLGLFNENPIERVHFYYKRWEKVFSNLKKWQAVVRLRNSRTNVCMTESVYDPLHEYASFKMRLGSGSKGGHHVHKSYEELLDLIDEFDKNAEDMDNQLVDLFPLEMQLHDLEGGAVENVVAFEDGAAEDSYIINFPLFLTVCIFVYIYPANFFTIILGGMK